MNKKIATVFLMLVMTLTVGLTSCGRNDNDMNKPDDTEDKVTDEVKDGTEDVKDDVKNDAADDVNDGANDNADMDKSNE